MAHLTWILLVACALWACAASASASASVSAQTEKSSSAWTSVRSAWEFAQGRVADSLSANIDHPVVQALVKMQDYLSNEQGVTVSNDASEVAVPVAIAAPEKDSAVALSPRRDDRLSAQAYGFPTRSPTYSPSFITFCATVVAFNTNQTSEQKCTTCLDAGCTWCDSDEYCFADYNGNACSSTVAGSSAACSLDLAALAVLIIIIIVISIVIPCLCCLGFAVVFCGGAICCVGATAASASSSAKNIPTTSTNPMQPQSIEIGQVVQGQVVQGQVVQGQVVQPNIVSGTVIYEKA